jgi:hypothetical protein
MKISNIERRLYNLNANDLKIKVDRTDWGWFVHMTGKINHNYYDVKVTGQISDKTHAMNERQVLAAFRAEDADYICAKPYHDESDIMSDYCAWNFYHRLNDLNYLQERQLSKIY